MEVEFNMEGVGLINVKGNKFTGKFSLSVDGKPMSPVGKRRFELGQGSDKLILTIDGSVIKGYSITHGKTMYHLSTAVPWYVYVIPVITFVIVMVLGNVPFFGEHGFYFVGGLIGGAIWGALAATSMGLAALVNKWWLRLLICLAGLVLTVGICLGVGNFIVWAARR